MITQKLLNTLKNSSRQSLSIRLSKSTFVLPTAITFNNNSISNFSATTDSNININIKQKQYQQFKKFNSCGNSSNTSIGLGHTLLFNNSSCRRNMISNMSTSTSNSSSGSNSSSENNMEVNGKNQDGGGEVVDPNRINANKSFLYRYLNNTYEHHPTWSKKWIIEKSYQMVVFAITGSSALHVVRYLLKNLWHVEGTVFGGPWQFTAAYFITMFTCYPFVLLFWGTLFGRHQFFKKFFLRMTIGFPQRIMKLLQKNKKQSIYINVQKAVFTNSIIYIVTYYWTLRDTENLDYIEFWVSNSKSFIKSFLQPLNYHPIGVKRTLQRVKYLVVNSPDLNRFNVIDGQYLNTLSFVVTTSISSEDNQFHSLRQSHNGDFIKTIAFNCTDAEHYYDIAVRGGAVPVVKPTSPFSGFKTATIQSPFQDVDHVFIQRRPAAPKDTLIGSILSLYPDFDPLDATQFKHYSKPSFPLSIHMDHVATCVKNGQLEKCIDWYSRCMGFNLLEVEAGKNKKEDSRVAQLIDEHSRSKQHKVVESQNYFNIKVEEDIGLKMVVLSNQPVSSVNLTTPPIMWVISEAAVDGKGQVEQFVKFNGGSGIQHLAFYTDNIFEAVDYARRHLLEFIEAPDYYYQNLSKREELDTVLPLLSKETINDLYEYKVLIDSDYSTTKEKNDHYILQSICDTPTFFFEMIKRSGAVGFGKGNIKALFEAVEMTQKKENSLVRSTA
ncbi:4-hydroxyphenylpyruvate dioxygenase-like protein [Heterostelium album PN500]|uniref:4-hydroxyphenylpyruvate dioxygenase-like protein n=1 Tax=Heterostelium pallidum (strain ATCC 26659 / Pp 5 / PN500) TaxID=670386 RepID=D3AZG2_HETP5|nr:4-hydroxyphenylpyruvate dioxygenase-like protein [Heterostelium album PN500]EFA85545.1 4-hydroxyphenylpyruvate dioxygenase-like protein [Heterostelium album PN500]|eukprot:XP_020437653.1 4-hydroxyphenylpyruvate dioxygenase-like protein [Heterostelium album PN500]